MQPRVGDKVIITYSEFSCKVGTICTIKDIILESIELDNRYSARFGNKNVGLQVELVVPNNPLSRVLYPNYIVCPQNPDYLVPNMDGK